MAVKNSLCFFTLFASEPAYFEIFFPLGKGKDGRSSLPRKSAPLPNPKGKWLAEHRRYDFEIRKMPRLANRFGKNVTGRVRPR